jgi:hypothetical protein
MKKFYILIIIGLIFFQTSCIKDITDLNMDPNNEQTADPHLVFKYSVKRGMGNYLTASHLEYNGLQQWTMYFASRGGVEPGNEYPSPPGGDGFWNENYIDAMNNAQVIIRLAEENPELVNMKAAAIIWKTFLAQRISDLWGDIPYSAALQGNPDLDFTPEYDLQEDIYLKMLSDLENAVNTFDDSKEFYNEDSDLIFGGNIDLWKRFANSLRLRMAIRISNADATLSNSVLNELAQQELIETNQQSATFQYNSVYNKPLFEAGSIRYDEGAQYINPSKFLVDLLVESSDPRIGFLLEKTSLSATYPFINEYRGVPNLLAYNSEIWDSYNLDAQLGDPLGQWGDVSRLGKWYLNNDRPFPILSFSEVCFLKAEAALNGSWPGDAMEYFKQGIRSHMEYINTNTDAENQITEMEILTYLNSFSEITLEKIITQKWILFAYENVFEAYADFRRTGFPVLKDYSGNPINTEDFPRRLKYPFSEFNLNRENYLNAVNNQGPDNSSTRIWWDTNNK